MEIVETKVYESKVWGIIVIRNRDVITVLYYWNSDIFKFISLR